MSRLDELLESFSVADPQFIEDPYPVLNALRESAPIFWDESANQWMVTRFADVSSLLRNRAFGRNYDHKFSHEELGLSGPDARWSQFNEHEKWSLLFLEPPDHTRLRRLVSMAFTPRAVANLTENISSLSDGLLDACENLGTFDLIANYAQPFSVGVICSMLGVPTSDTQLLLDWSHAIVKMYEVSVSHEAQVAADRAAGEYIRYTRDLIAEKRRRPDGLLVSELARVEEQGDMLTEAEIVSTTMVILEAAHEATVNTLGNGFRALMHHRDQWDRITSGQVETSSAVEELLRWDPPLQLFTRWVLEPGVEICGQSLAVGDTVAMLFGSAQRDPRRFPSPDLFDVGRNDPAHIGFGGGIHYCLGAPLARQEIACAVDGISKRFPKLRLSEEPTYHPTFVLRGLKELILKVE